ncbi:MAG TPA: NifB/NifX family molybdenum-iron cluster-binding protein [Vicinamibacteria bacterium]|nr:NifB/NifX family molybdenum-iron cluster-binding protein [Vicinamibacteria bacterium]
MKLCIPTLGAEGLAAELSDHFGAAPHMTLLDSESGEVGALASGHSEGKDCGRVGLLDGRQVDAVVVRGGIGRGAYAALAQRGIAVLVCSGGRVADVLAEARGGALRPMGAEQTCSHHHHGHHQGEGCAD